jgi:hypothetical protein
MVPANLTVLISFHSGVNMLRILPLLLLLAAPLAAQDTSSLSGSVPNGRRLTYLYQIDFGATSTTWTLACGLTTNSNNGLLVRLIDLDGLASSSQTNPDSIDETAITGFGTANVSLNGTYSGMREFAVEIETAQGTSASDYNGNLTSNAGTISLLRQDQLILSATGLRTTVQRFAFWDGTAPPGSVKPASVELDFGSGTKTLFIRFDGIGSNLERIELFDVTNGNGTSLATFTTPSTGDVTVVSLTHSGIVFLRVNIKAVPSQTGSGSWAISAPSGIKVKRVSPDTDGGDNHEEGCSTTQTAPSLLLVVLLSLAAGTLIWRRA